MNDEKHDIYDIWFYSDEPTLEEEQEWLQVSIVARSSAT